MQGVQHIGYQENRITTNRMPDGHWEEALPLPEDHLLPSFGSD